ncbi:hypothetical protein KIN34_09410 [Cellulomonas sp. DKR-3]|uniref:Lipoprotein n=1 Tax=Cellulomonas fulva TaxID=2835530 RepID=A0ABS5TZB5_9CELL|nr:hypothetical protein [Cellulomonas fulva]MBT0994503.1 hypothetical protein [Cellulomonas fulva]
MPLLRRSDACRGAAALLAPALLLGGCAWGPSATDRRTVETLTSALDEAASGVAVAELVVLLVETDRTTTPVADVTLADALGDVGGAQDALARDMPDLPHQPARDRGLAAVADATAAVADTRAWVNGTSTSTTAQVRGALEDAADAIEQVTTELGR